MSKLVYVQMNNEQYEETLEIPGQTNHYFFREQMLTTVVDKMIKKIKTMEYYNTSDEIEFEICYTTDTTLSGQVSINGDIQWDMEIHLAEFED